MLHYSEILDGFEGSDDDVEDDSDDIMTIEDLVDQDEVDDTEEPAVDDYCEELIGI